MYIVYQLQVRLLFIKSTEFDLKFSALKKIETGTLNFIPSELINIPERGLTPL